MPVRTRNENTGAEKNGISPRGSMDHLECGQARNSGERICDKSAKLF
jgi:hypothetical protein